MDTRGTSQSASEYSLLLKKLPTVNKKFWHPLNLVPKKYVSIIAFRITLTLDLKIVWFGRQVTFCVLKRHKNAILGVVGFKSWTLTVYCLSSWFVHQQRKTYSNLCVLWWPSHTSWFPEPKYIPPSFWLWVTYHEVKSKMSKSDFLGHCSFTQLFHDVKKLMRKPKILMKVIQRFWYVQHAGLMF